MGHTVRSGCPRILKSLTWDTGDSVKMVDVVVIPTVESGVPGSTGTGGQVEHRPYGTWCLAAALAPHAEARG